MENNIDNIESTDSIEAVKTDMDSSAETTEAESKQLKPMVRERKVDKLGRSYGTGRRKTSVARVWFKKQDSSKANFTVNGKDVNQYFSREFYNDEVKSPLDLLITETEGYEIMSTVKGGGLTGQCGAVKLGLSRALLCFDPELHGILRKKGLLTRDSRKVERKKYGHLKARKVTQYSKR
ncbi:30S ribosomal protein S9 [Candidatus Cytomitobacter indipagum]|uniref:Small ribosomal subunit protein uS9 n=1 Tax=Candidatus Cytomitobacter indipagum TaxID=2601575 RepID=A0A5C0UEQ2_9PROT|nr:30S ribosomal protein S9 [Candidatus Cytomitobacter indipagum]QEK38180.1 30S ribosomal protein S9 [Candidatus Cytomitobacter indipagum]